MKVKAPPCLGATPDAAGTHFAVWSAEADSVVVCLFDAEGAGEERRVVLAQDGEGVHHAFVEGVAPGARYGLRADGPYNPGGGWWFDPNKLLVDPYALAIDRPYVYDPRLTLPRDAGVDTAPLMPKGVVCPRAPRSPHRPPLYQPGGLIYEIPVRAFTHRHPDLPEALRGTIGALAHPVILAHLAKLNVAAVELMPITAWIDERHLPPLKLTNGWGYNPVSFMALDPRLAPGGWAELRDTVETLRRAGIGVILDLVFNHTGESDAKGPTLSLRGLANLAYYRHDDGGRLINDTGCGNTLACDHPVVRRLILDALRNFVTRAGVDGFRFDLATILGRTMNGFDPGAQLLGEMAADPVLADRVMIAEPWDIGPGGYQLGNFPPNFLEWNDRARDDLRRFWRGDGWMAGALATRLAGSSDIFAGSGAGRTRSVNFLAAHDGFTLADIVAYEHKHNEANGEENRDGHNENLSWNNGVEGESSDPDVRSARRSDIKALLSTLFASRGSIMLTAGDELGRSQGGNNNAYCHDNDIVWLDWLGRDREIEDHVAVLSQVRSAFAALHDTAFLTDGDVEWLTPAGLPFAEGDWNNPTTDCLLMRFKRPTQIAVAINRGRGMVSFTLPGGNWRVAGEDGQPTGRIDVAPRSVVFVVDDSAKA